MYTNGYRCVRVCPMVCVCVCLLATRKTSSAKLDLILARMTEQSRASRVAMAAIFIKFAAFAGRIAG